MSLLRRGDISYSHPYRVPVNVNSAAHLPTHSDVVLLPLSPPRLREYLELLAAVLLRLWT